MIFMILLFCGSFVLGMYNLYETNLHLSMLYFGMAFLLSEVATHDYDIGCLEEDIKTLNAQIHR